MTISVIIPALDEAPRISSALASATAGNDVEVVVVDGGSGDGTAGIAKRGGANLVQSAPPRARQMNAGARASKGGILLFLHADGVLPAGFDEAVRSTLQTPGVVAGAFSLGLDGTGSSLRRIERGANWRARRLGLPYGDQALFLERRVFDELGAFPELPIMEDFEFARRLRRRGRVAISPGVVVSSARRWEACGVLRTTLINQAVILGYVAGVAPARLARWYDRAGALETARRSTPQGVPR